jgi:hypothetical protein
MVMDTPDRDVGDMVSHFDRLETVLVSVQDRCMVCTKHTIGSKIILDAPDSTPNDVGQVEAQFGRYHRLSHCFRRTQWNS